MHIKVPVELVVVDEVGSVVGKVEEVDNVEEVDDVEEIEVDDVEEIEVDDVEEAGGPHVSTSIPVDTVKAKQIKINI